MEYKYNYKKNKRGFTLVESLVAISILTIAVVSTLTATQLGLRNSNIVSDNVVSFWLAQEGMEFVKNMRDENALMSLAGTPTNWLSGLSAVSGDPCWYGGGGTSQKICRIDSQLGTVTYCGTALGSCPVLRRQASTGLYGYTSASGWTQTRYKREMRITRVTDNEVKVDMFVTWTARGVSKTFQATETFFNR